MISERPTASTSTHALLATFTSSLQTSLLTDAGLDFLLVCTSFVGAHLLRFGSELPTLTQAAFVLPTIGLLKVGVFYQFRLYRTVWRHAGTPDALRLVQASSVASGGLLLGLMVLPNIASLPIAFLVLDWMLTTITTGAHRFGRRAVNQYRMAPKANPQRILIYGADARGVLLLRYLQHAVPTTSVVGFLDPDRDGRQLRDHPIVDTPAALDADALIVPISPSAPQDDNFVQDRKQVIDTYAPLDLSCQQFKLTMDASAVSRD